MMRGADTATREGTVTGHEGNAHLKHGLFARLSASLRRWLHANTFTPSWLTSPWSRHPAIAYLVVLLLQGLTAFVTLLLAHVFPALVFRSALPLLMVVLVALTWGAGPSLFATLVGVVVADYVLLPPSFTWTLQTASDGASVVLFVAIGLVLSIVGSNSERHRREAYAASQRLLTLQEVTDTALAYLGLDELLRQVLGRVTQILGVDNTAILLLDETTQELVVHLAHGPEDAVDGQVRIPLGHGIAGRIAARQKALIVDDLAEVEVANPFLREHIRSLMGAPLRVDGHTIGVLHAGTVALHRFTAEDLSWLQVVADRVALAVDRARLYQQAQAERVQAQEQAQRLSAILETATDGIFVFGRTGEVLQANAAARALFELADSPATPLYQHEPQAIVHDERDQPLAEQHWPTMRVLQGEVLTGPSTVSLRLRWPDGRALEVDVSGAPVRDQEGQIVSAVCVVRDVTKRRQLERRTHEALEALLAMAQTLLHLPQEDSMADTEPHALRGVGQRLVALTRDLLGCQRIGLVAYDRHSGVQHPLAVAGLSPALEQAWWESVEGAPVSDPQVPIDPQVVARFLAGEVMIVDMTQPPFDALPNPFGIRTVLSAPLHVAGATIGSLSLDYGSDAHDYTPDEVALAGAVAQLAALVLERERLLGERADAQASELTVREVNRRMDEFLSIATHELRSPLTSIRGNLQLLQRRLQRILPPEGEGSASVQELLQRAVDQTSRVGRMVTDLLDVSRIQTGHLELHREVCDLSTLVRRGLEEAQHAWPARTIRLDLPEGAVQIDADADRIEQVIVNYVTNALKYSTPDQPVVVSLQVADTAACVEVRDQGAGLTPEQQQEIWERYRRAQGVAVQDDTQAAGGGLGLGLYISRTIIDEHGGTMGVKSAPGAGSTFWFTLPLAT